MSLTMSLADQIAHACAAGLSDNEQAPQQNEAEVAEQRKKVEANVNLAIEQIVTNAEINGRANEPYLVLVNIADLNDSQPPSMRLNNHQQLVVQRCREKRLLPRWADQPCPPEFMGGMWQLRIWLAGLTIYLDTDSVEARNDSDNAVFMHSDINGMRTIITNPRTPLAERIKLAYALGRAEQLQAEERTRQQQEQLRLDAEAKAEREITPDLAKLLDHVRSAAKNGDRDVVVFTFTVTNHAFYQRPPNENTLPERNQAVLRRLNEQNLNPFWRFFNSVDAAGQQEFPEWRLCISLPFATASTLNPKA
jgi:hypothetical protein